MMNKVYFTLIYTFLLLRLDAQKFELNTSQGIELYEQVIGKYIVLFHDDLTEIECRDMIDFEWEILDFIPANGEEAFAIISSSSETEFNSNESGEYEVYPYVKNSKGIEFGVSPYIYAEVKRPIDSIILEERCRELGLIVVKSNQYLPEWYVIRLGSSELTVFENCNKLNELNIFNIVYPSFVSSISYNSIGICPTNDPDFNTLQWNLENTGQYSGTAGIDVNFCEGSQISLGNNNITIAIMDQGFLHSHSDINNTVSGYDVANTTTPDALYGPHGMQCAGIIGAKISNYIGLTGIAPECKLMPLSTFAPSFNFEMDVADAFMWAADNDVDVINNSWYKQDAGPILEAGIHYALTNGRDGLGTVVVFASGNFDSDSIYAPQRNAPQVIVVGGINYCGERWSFSNNSCDGLINGSDYGTQLDVVAPSTRIWSTYASLVNGNYVENYASATGTSFAAPHVAALAGLILSVNPCLTNIEVNNIIESTCQKVGGYNYQANTPNRPNGTWNEEMGYGLIDNYAALQAAFGSSYFQDDIENGTLLHKQVGYIRAGKEVTQDLPYNNYTVSNSGNLEFQATKSITLENGFTASSGSQFLAKIVEPPFNNCNNWSYKNLWVQDNSAFKNVNTTAEPTIQQNPNKIQFFPNPYTEELYIKYSLELDNIVELTFIDYDGKIVAEYAFNGEKGSNIHLIKIATETKMLIANVCIDEVCTDFKLKKNE
jgi:hypothetical protein